MDSLFAISGEGFVIMAADGAVGRSIMKYQNEKDKILKLDSHKLLGSAGPQFSTNEFAQYIQKNLNLKRLRNRGRALNMHSSANFMRSELAYALRRGPYQTNILFGGYDESLGKSSLYWMDYLGSMQKVNFGAHGYASHFILSVFDREYVDGMSVEQGIDVIRKCINELQTRFLISQTNFIVKIVDADGTRVISLDDEMETKDEN